MPVSSTPEICERELSLDRILSYFRHEDDNHHMEYIPVYEVFPLKPSDSHHVEMLLLAYHWNNAAM